MADELLRSSNQRQHEMLQVGKRYLTPIVRATQAQVQAMGTTEITLVSGVPNYVLLPTAIAVKKFSGAYTVVGVTMLTLGWGTVADNIACCPWGNAPAFSVLVDAGATAYLTIPVIGNGFSAGLPYGPFSATGVVGKKLALRTNGASPAGAGGELRVRLWYQAIPYSYLDMPL